MVVVVVVSVRAAMAPAQEYRYTRSETIKQVVSARVELLLESNSWAPTADSVRLQASPPCWMRGTSLLIRRSLKSEKGRIAMNYRLLAASGLRVYDVSLGAMTFGKEGGWGSAKDEAQEIYACAF